MDLPPSDACRNGSAVPSASPKLRYTAHIGAFMVLLALTRASAFAENKKFSSDAAAGGRASPERLLAQSKAAPAEASENPAKSKRAQAAGKPGTVTARAQWREQLRREIEACRELGIFARGFCMDKAKFKHCYPDRWDTVPECASTHAPQPGGPGN